MLSYGITDYFKIKYGHFIVLSIFLSLFLIVFPLYFRLPEKTIQNYCDFYYYFDYFHIYWNIGMALVLAAHFTYCYLINRKSKNT
ncbi:hypothetical protein FLA105534_04275 [Flavobacterium bizetiae]|nr:hypothetical protein FLA105534_04275 [Flavobacterium bizetiae]